MFVLLPTEPVIGSPRVKVATVQLPNHSVDWLASSSLQSWFCALLPALPCPCRYIDYMRLVLGAKARELYQSLDTVLDPKASAAAAKAGGAAAAPATFIDVLSTLFREVALAVEQDEVSIIETFGAGALLDVVIGVQAECDSQGLRMLQRFVEARRVTQLVSVSAAALSLRLSCLFLLFARPFLL